MSAARLSNSPRARPWVGLLAFLGLVAVVAIVGSVFAADAAEVYTGLDRPRWAPPAWLFGPVWTVLYVLIGVSGWLAWRTGASSTRNRAMFTVYGVQLALNAFWTPLFFGLGAYSLALLDIVLLWAAILITIVAFAPVSRTAAVLLTPYLAWVSYAAALNAALR